MLKINDYISDPMTGPHLDNRQRGKEGVITNEIIYGK